MSQHLGSYINLLRVAKEIINSDLEQKLLNTVSFNEYEAANLPAEIQANVNTFIQSMRKNLVVNDSISEEITEEFFGASFEKDAKEEELEKGLVYGQTDLNHLKDEQNKAIQAGIGYFESWLQFQGEIKLSAEASKYYDEQLELMEVEFKKNIAAIDDKANLLRSIIMRINTAGNTETLKEGMLMLAEISGDKLTKDDVMQLLKGDKIIEI